MTRKVGHNTENDDDQMLDLCQHQIATNDTWILNCVDVAVGFEMKYNLFINPGLGFLGCWYWYIWNRPMNTEQRTEKKVSLKIRFGFWVYSCPLKKTYIIVTQIFISTGFYNLVPDHGDFNWLMWHDTLIHKTSALSFRRWKASNSAKDATNPDQSGAKTEAA